VRAENGVIIHRRDQSKVKFNEPFLRELIKIPMTDLKAKLPTSIGHSPEKCQRRLLSQYDE